MIILRPSIAEIEKYVGLTVIASSIETPSYNKDEWNKSHRDFVLKVLLPQIQPPVKTWKAVVEAYLTDVYLENTNKLSTFEED